MFAVTFSQSLLVSFHSRSNLDSEISYHGPVLTIASVYRHFENGPVQGFILNRFLSFLQVDHWTFRADTISPIHFRHFARRRFARILVSFFLLNVSRCIAGLFALVSLPDQDSRKGCDTIQLFMTFPSESKQGFK